MNNKIFYLFLLITINWAFGCRILMINDSDKTIQLTENSTAQTITLNPNEEQLIGDPQQHVQATVAIKESEDHFIPTYRFEMVACAADKSKPVTVKMSELESGTISSLFTMSKEASMQEVLIPQSADNDIVLIRHPAPTPAVELPTKAVSTRHTVKKGTCCNHNH